MLVKHTEFLNWLQTENEVAENLRILLERDQFEQVASRLAEILPLENPTADLILTHTILVMRNVCDSLHQAQRETDWHHWALQHVKARETELRSGLYAILELADDVIGTHSQPLLEDRNNARELASNQRPRTDPANHVRRLLRRSRNKTKNQPRLSASPLPQTPYDMTVYALGDFHVYLGETLVEDLSNGKGAAIFKFLLLNRGRPVQKEKLLDVIWSEVEEACSLDRLNGAIYSLRQALRAADPEQHIILYENHHYRLNPELQIWTDVDEFLQRCQRARRAAQENNEPEAIAEYEAALLLYAGDLMSENYFMEWLEFERQKLKSEYLNALDKLTEHYLQTGDHLACQSACQRMLEADGTSEVAHSRLMQLYTRSGQPQLAKQQYHLCLLAFKSHGELKPSAAAALYARIRQGEAV